MKTVKIKDYYGDTHYVPVSDEVYEALYDIHGRRSGFANGILIIAAELPLMTMRMVVGLGKATQSRRS